MSEVDVTTFNAARITKLYGTVAAKGDNTAERPHRLSAILEDPGLRPGEVVTREQLSAVASRLPEEPARTFRSSAGGMEFDLEDWIHRYNLPVRGPISYGADVKWLGLHGQPCLFGGEHNSEGFFLIKRASGPIQAGCHHQSCADKYWRDLRLKFEPDAYRRSSDPAAAVPAASGLRGKVGSEVTPQKLSWLWPRHLPLGKQIEFCGDPATLKTAVALDLSARVTVGAPFPTEPAGRTHQPAKVLFLSAEDDASDTLLPRFLAAGGDPKLIHFVTAIDGLPTLPDDAAELDKWIKALKPALLVFDPIDAFFGSKVKVISNPDVRRALLPLIQIGAESKVTSLLIRHLNKDAKTGRAMYRGAGSIGITAACRASYILGPDPNDPDAFVFACIKLNGAPKPSSIGYQVERFVIERDGQPDIETQHIEWIEETDHSADQLVGGAGPGPRGPDPETLEAAIALLYAKLDDGRWHPSKPIIDAANSRDISYRTLARARNSLGVLSTKKLFSGGWHWGLPIPPKNLASSTKPLGEKDPTEDAIDAKPPNNLASSKKPLSPNNFDHFERSQDARFSDHNLASSINPFSPNTSINSLGAENPEDAEIPEGLGDSNPNGTRDRPSNGASPTPDRSPNSSVLAKFVITREDKARLRAIGYSERDIGFMTPAQVQQILDHYGHDTGRNGKTVSRDEDTEPPPDVDPSINGFDSTMPEWMRGCLRELDYSEPEIAELTLAEARDVINYYLREMGFSDPTLDSITPEQTLDAIRGERFGGPEKTDEE